MTMPSFQNKWRTLARAGDAEKEKEDPDLFVPEGAEPQTQRQLNLYHYFLFIRDVLRKNNAREVLEVGCGRGTISLYLAKYLGLTIHLLDDSEDAIAVAKDLFAKHGQEAQFYVQDALATAFFENRFDATVSIGLAEHLDDVEKLFVEQYRILRPGGVMITLNIPKKFSIQFLNTIMRFCKKITGSYGEKVGKDYYRNSLSPEAYARAARNAGFTQMSITHVAPFPLYTPVRLSTDRFITSINKKILKVRSMVMRYPYASSRVLSQAHFLVAHKPHV